VNKDSDNARPLASKEHWDEWWASGPVRSLPFNPLRRNFRDLHSLFLRTLPRLERTRFLEIGCYPGGFLWYFSRYFGYAVCGIEYIDWCCRETRRLLEACGVQGEIIQADIFDYEQPAEDRLWDVVASFGFLEHFQDSRAVLKKHLELLKPGGYLVLTVPNHQALYGKILEWAAPELYKIHHILSLEQIVDALRGAGEVEIVEEGYYGRLGLGHTGIYLRAKETNPFISQMARALVFGLETAGLILPRSRLLSPMIAVIARKKPGI